MTYSINNDFKFLHHSAEVKEWLFVLFLFIGFSAFGKQNSGIDRKALVSRHNITIKDKSLKGPTQVGNGEFAFGFQDLYWMNMAWWTGGGYYPIFSRQWRLALYGCADGGRMG
jgi:hypothetical protein